MPAHAAEDSSPARSSMPEAERFKATALGAACQVAVLTPPGRGAVATIAVAGSQATGLVASKFRAAGGRPLDEVPVNRIAFGRWIAADAPGEEVVVARRAEDEVEIHCHGGRFAAGAIVESLRAAGAREVSWDQFAARHEPGGLEADARRALSAARTERTAAILLDQWRGVLRASLEQAVDRLRSGEVAGAAAILNELERWARVGLHLTEPWRVVLTGRPNVGKSSLINAVLGFERCIVHTAPGTTRDVVTAHTALDGWPVELADTAGWRAGGDEIEAAGLQRAEWQLRQADLIVLVFDLSAPWTDDDQALGAAWPAALILHNKCDLTPFASANRPPGLRVSAVQAGGVADLVRELARRLVPEPPPTGTAVPFTQPQVQAVRSARAALTAGNAPRALILLEELLGQVPLPRLPSDLDRCS
jgi:tRNA modification GTPase